MDVPSLLAKSGGRRHCVLGILYCKQARYVLLAGSRKFLNLFVAHAGMGAYAAAKKGLEGFAAHILADFRQSNIKVRPCASKNPARVGI